MVRFIGGETYVVSASCGKVRSKMLWYSCGSISYPVKWIFATIIKLPEATPPPRNSCLPPCWGKRPPWPCFYSEVEGNKINHLFKVSPISMRASVPWIQFFSPMFPCIYSLTLLLYFSFLSDISSMLLFHTTQKIYLKIQLSHFSCQFSHV